MKNLILAFALILTSCASAPQPICSVPAKHPMPSLPVIQPITSAPVSIKIDSQGNAVIDPSSYQNLQINILDISRWISDEKALNNALTNILKEESK